LVHHGPTNEEVSLTEGLKEVCNGRRLTVQNWNLNLFCHEEMSVNNGWRSKLLKGRTKTVSRLK
jgi:hypothetical protein